ncbi:ATP-binding cassette domain-containing protein [Ruthenibacterium sp. CLA-JM-H11]|uniref:ATP-binding cassette domain-containing protein n=1 Tax=Ruthenibacterium intestinale TaxID=3133163 RepID=A0ABV1GCJ9_9FIRM
MYEQNTSMMNTPERNTFLLPAMVEGDFSSDEIAEDADGLQMMSFQRVKIPAGGALQFEIPTEDPDNPDYARTLEGVILYNHSAYILVDGQPLAKTDRLLKARLGYLPQDFGLFDELTVTQFLDYMAALKGISNSKAAIQKTIQAVNLEEKAKSKIRTLSGGQRQRVGIAQALLGNPPFLIFDEPTVGLDPEERIHFRNLFSRTAEDRLVLLSTHIIEDVQSVCDQIVVINHGNILFTGTPEQLIQSAAGHVGVFWEKDEVQEKGLHITARVNTSQGIRCRAVADKLPAYAQADEPSLEDAYLYLISREVAQ